MASASVVGRPSTKNTCSICLEPFKGRFPKLLPCFHTFCSPCLTEIADRVLQQHRKVRNKRAAEIIITCPTCRRDCAVPPGGVPAFQKNFYLEQDGEEQSQSHLLPMICDLCDQGQVASHMCTNCQLKLCFHCHRSHGQCQLAQRPQKEAPALPEGDVQQFFQRGRHQVKVMERVLTVLDEDEAELHRQRKKLEADICHLYTALDGLMRGIKLQADGEEEKLKKKKIELRNKFDTLNRILEQGSLPASSMAVSEVKAALYSESEVAEMEKRSRQEKTQDFFTDKISRDNIDILLRKTNAMFGAPSSLHAGAALSEAADVDPRLLFGDGHDLSSASNQQSSRNDGIAQKMELLMKRMNESESQGRKTQGELNEMRAMRDKNMILAQEVAALQAENGNMKGEMRKLQAENGNMKGEMSKLQDMKGEISKLQADLKSISSSQQSSAGQTIAVNRQLETDMKSSQVQIGNILQQLKSLQESQKKTGTEHGTQMSNLNAQIRTLSTPVYFHAALNQEVVTTNKRVLILKVVDTNVGGGYNSSTGFFHAPVSGCYLFLVSITPISENDMCEVDIVLEGTSIGYAFCWKPTENGIGASTGHSVITLNAGQRVWLRTTNRKSSFRNSQGFCFTGVLLTPSL